MNRAISAYFPSICSERHRPGQSLTHPVRDRQAHALRGAARRRRAALHHDIDLHH